MGLVVLAGGLTSILLTISYSGFAVSFHAIVKILLVVLGAFFLILMFIGLANIRDEVDRIIKK